MKRLKKLWKTVGNKITAALLAAAIVAVAFGLFVMQEEKRSIKDIRVVCMGDSLFGNTAYSPTIPAIMEEETGIRIFNGAFGGTCMSCTNHEGRSTFFEDDLNMCHLAEAVAYRDFTVQQYGINGNTYQLDYFKDSLKQLAQMDFTQVELLFIEHGTNDYNSGARLDDAENPYNTDTFGGALRYSIELLQKEYPQMKLVLVTPAYCYFTDENGKQTGDSDTLDFGGGTLPDFVELEKQIAAEYGLDIIDWYYGSGITAKNIEQYTLDGLHFNEEGRRLLAQPLIDYLKKEMEE